MSDKCIVQNGKTKYSVYTADKFKQLLLDLGANITSEIATLLASGKCIVRNGNRKYTVYTASRVDEILSNLSELPYETKTLTTNKDVVDSDLTDYPVLVRLDSSNYDFSKSRADGYDIQFYMSGVQLSHETVVFDQVNEKALYYVKVPNLSSTENITFEMRYGDTSIGLDTSNKNDVWSNGFVGVWHLGYSLADSTVNGNDVINHGTTVVDGLFGKGRKFTRANSNYIEIPYSASIDFSQGNDQNIMALFKYDKNAGSQILTQRTDYDWGININSTTQIRNHINTNGTIYYPDYQNPIISNEYCMLETRSTSTVPLLYFNGGLVTKNTDNSTSNRTMYNYPAFIGAGGGATASGGYMEATIDEFRISKSLRSPAWVKADDHNLRLNDLIDIT